LHGLQFGASLARKRAPPLGTASSRSLAFGEVLGWPPTEDLPCLLLTQRSAHGDGLQGSGDGCRLCLEPLHVFAQELLLPTAVHGDIGRRIIEDDGDLLKGEPELSVKQHLGEPRHVSIVVESVAGIASSNW